MAVVGVALAAVFGVVVAAVAAAAAVAGDSICYPTESHYPVVAAGWRTLVLRFCFVTAHASHSNLQP